MQNKVTNMIKKVETKAAYGIFDRVSSAEVAKLDLQQRGFAESDITTLLPTHFGSRYLPPISKTRIQMGAVLGASFGGIIFFVLAVLTNMKVFAITQFADNPLFSEQVLFALGALLFGVLFGAASGALIGIGTPKSESHLNGKYNSYMNNAGTLISVQIKSADEARLAIESLTHSGAKNITIMTADEGWPAMYAENM